MVGGGGGGGGGGLSLLIVEQLLQLPLLYCCNFEILTCNNLAQLALLHGAQYYRRWSAVVRQPPPIHLY